jgi:hypothetical protein
VFVGVGGRRQGDDYGLIYPVADVAVRRGAGVTEPTEAEHAYDDAPQTTRGPCPDGVLPDA